MTDPGGVPRGCTLSGERFIRHSTDPFVEGSQNHGVESEFFAGAEVTIPFLTLHLEIIGISRDAAGNASIIETSSRGSLPIETTTGICSP